MSTSIDAKVAALDNILATPAGAPNKTLELLNKAKGLDYWTGKIDTPFGNLNSRDVIFLMEQFNKMGISDPSKLTAQVSGDNVIYRDGTTGRVVQEAKVSEGGSLKLGEQGSSDVKGYDLYMVPNAQGGLTLSSDYVKQGGWVNFRDKVLKPAAIAATAYFGAPLLGEALGATGAGASSTFSVQSSSFTATSNSSYWITGNNVTVTLPASPSDNDFVRIVNASSVTGCTVGRNGKKIMGLSEDLTIDPTYFSITLVYYASSTDWILT